MSRLGELIILAFDIESHVGRHFVEIYPQQFFFCTLRTTAAAPPPFLLCRPTAALVECGCHAASFNGALSFELDGELYEYVAPTDHSNSHTLGVASAPQNVIERWCG
jgi:hypothetical protein